MTPPEMLAMIRSAFPDITHDGDSFRYKAPHHATDEQRGALKLMGEHSNLLALMLLRPRLDAGADYLWEREQEGTMNTPEYDRLLQGWQHLLKRYEERAAQERRTT